MNADDSNVRHFIESRAWARFVAPPDDDDDDAPPAPEEGEEELSPEELADAVRRCKDDALIAAGGSKWGDLQHLVVRKATARTLMYGEV